MEEDWEGGAVDAEENEPEDQQQLFGEEEEEEDEEEDILGGDDGPVTNDKESLLMRFCPHDSSMLYPQVSFCSLRVFRRVAQNVSLTVFS
jgi:hypothetical protein